MSQRQLKPKLAIETLPKNLFFTGKGGVSKTTTSTAAAIALAERGKQMGAAMDATKQNKGQHPQAILRGVVELCADCDTCRFLMDEDCAFFPELYRLWDREKESAIPISEGELRHLAEFCSLCGLCPCPKVPIDVMAAKSLYIEREGLPLATHLRNDVPRLARLCGTFPRLANALQASRAAGPLLRKVVGIHPERRLPDFPPENFFQWAEARGLTEPREGNRKIAYFAGCTAGYLFPQVGRALVTVLERNGVTVYVPPQRCCGMPQLVEGDRRGALRLAQANLKGLLEPIRAGCDILSSCPTCGYFMKVLLKERAYFSEAYQRSVQAGEDELKIPDFRPGSRTHRVFKKSIYRDLLKDDGYFSLIDPMARLELAEHCFDAGEYLARLQAEGLLDIRFRSRPGRHVYFAPCHQREQKMGRPYLDLLGLVPEMEVVPVGATNCCGMGGNVGFKLDGHDPSLALGRPLLDKIVERDPQAIVTDCLSCRLQFAHALPYPVYHPLEILAQAYQAG